MTLDELTADWPKRRRELADDCHRELCKSLLDRRRMSMMEVVKLGRPYGLNPSETLNVWNIVIDWTFGTV